MLEILVGTSTGCTVFSRGTQAAVELPGRCVGPFTRERAGGCVAIVDQREIWRRSPAGFWAKATDLSDPVQSLVATEEGLLLGGLDDASLFLVRSDLHSDGEFKTQVMRVTSFDEVPGRSEWFASGPPLGVRSLATLAQEERREGQTGSETWIVAVHVGGMPRSDDSGGSWTPTIPVHYDVHEVCAHPSQAQVVAAATAVGLCVSVDGGASWDLYSAGLPTSTSLAVTVLEEEVLFSVQDGPFAARSQIWRWPLVGGALTPVREGLPEWLEGKVDTAQMVSGRGRAAICDGGGNLWLSTTQSSGWRCIGRNLGYALGLVIL